MSINLHYFNYLIGGFFLPASEQLAPSFNPAHRPADGLLPLVAHQHPALLSAYVVHAMSALSDSDNFPRAEYLSDFYLNLCENDSDELKIIKAIALKGQGKNDWQAIIAQVNTNSLDTDIRELASTVFLL